MANRVSPGVYVNVFDFSEYAPQLGTATLCVVGGASKGPLNVPTLVTNEAALVRQFGIPLLTDYALQAAVQFLKKGSRLVFVRVHDGTAVSADVPVPGFAAGTAATKAAGTVSFTGSVNPSDGDSVTVSDKLPTALLNNDATGAAGNVTVTRVGANITVAGMSGGTGSVKATGTIKLTGQPADGNTVVIGDGATSKTFEFDSNASVGGGNVAVTIGADVYATMTNLIAAIQGASSFNVSAAPGHVSKTFEFDSNNAVTGGNVPVLIGASASASLLNLMAAVNAQTTVPLQATNATITVPALALTHKVAGADGNATVRKSGANIVVTGLTGGADAVTGSVTNVLAVAALNPGTWGNSLQVKVQATTTLGAVAGRFDLLVYAPLDDSGTLQLVERFNNLSLSSSDERFVETMVAEGLKGEANKSQYIAADVLAADGQPGAGTYTLGAGGGNVGTDGVSGLAASHYIGTVNGQTPSGLQAIKNPEKVDFNILAVPGVSHKDVIAEMLAVATFRNDCIVLVDPPFGATRDNVVDWHNGVGALFANSPVAPLDSRFGALYWSWVKQTDSYNRKKLFLPPSGFVAAAFAFNDLTAGPQYAPAGHVRGVVDGLEVEYSPDQAERDLLVGDQNRVNPIVDFAQGGLTVFGNRTLQRRRTALDNVHVQRMLIYAQKIIATTVKVLVFEPNDRITWLKFTALVNPILENLKQGRGIEQFVVICDETTNPPEQRQNKTMRGLIKIKPVEAAEIIEIDFALFATGAEFTEV